MATALSDKSIGTPDNIFNWWLHSSGGTLAAGFAVGLGTGDDTPLWLSSTGVGVKSAGGFVCWLVSNATATQTVNLADFSGTLYPETRVYLGANKSNNTVTTSAIAGFTFMPDVSATYEVEMILLATSAATTTGVQLTLTGPAAGASITLVQDNAPLSITAIGGVYAATSAPVATTPFLIVLRGILTTATVVSAAIGLSLASEVAASQVQILAGSMLKFRRRA